MFNRDDNRGHDTPHKSEYTGKWTCSKCLKESPHSLPFTPTGDRPVYCKDCYRQMKQEQGR